MEWKGATTPLALCNLLHDRKRLLVAVVGIGFAVLLMCMQIGFYNAMLDSTVELLRELDADLVIQSRGRYNVSLLERFPRARLTQAMSLPEIKSATPIYIETLLAQWKNPDSGRLQPIRALAFPPQTPVMLLPDVRRQQHLLHHPLQLLTDRKSKIEYGLSDNPIGLKTELAEQAVEVVGTFSLGTDFANDGNVLMSDRTFAMLFGPQGSGMARLEQVDLGLIKLHPAARAKLAVIRWNLEQLLPDDVVVLTKAEIMTAERNFWLRATPIGFVFQLGTLMGFLVGMIICYQILYSDIDDHLREFATLKAIGYRKIYFIGLVLQQSLMLSLIGFLPGLLASMWLYERLAQQTGLLMFLTWERAILVLILTMVMCILSGCLAMRRVLNLDPAELF